MTEIYNEGYNTKAHGEINLNFNNLNKLAFELKQHGFMKGKYVCLIY